MAELFLALFSHFVSITSVPSALTISGVLVKIPCSLVDDSQRIWRDLLPLQSKSTERKLTLNLRSNSPKFMTFSIKQKRNLYLEVRLLQEICQCGPHWVPFKDAQLIQVANHVELWKLNCASITGAKFSVQSAEMERDGRVGKQGLEVHKWVSSNQEIPICCPYL
jgi:hypothetical protein